ncbi:tellurium resistance protein TerC [Prauserella marina]|uniref:Tellurite resistance protein TerC n=1 Tax=Prauserella marina TaxID=530584 RepID=A0A222VU88_9PSEU|nr:TerC family protein [Prauserella marina]ASR37497.1 tellurium resistance protein TerC [Prauserella marina]PWV74605.1 tellurite resistance protein TerC [Prauserella marina]SDD45486.1 tellurite resistance protein TerC [Prauserella marina]
MNIPWWVWLVTVGGLVAIICFDFYLVSRNPRHPSLRECTLWVCGYVSLAALFGLGVVLLAGGQYGGEFFAGWITEYSLSVDNLFVFVIIMSSFAVPKEYRQKVLLIGIVIALLLRGLFIAVGAEVITRFDWLFYVFGAFLLYTAWKLLSHKNDDDEEFKENAVLRTAKRFLPATDEYNGAKLTIKESGRRLVTPMLIVMIAIGTTDLLFALDSIPAIFGLTKEPYLVFTANAFALMGLRQLFFLIGGLLDRLVYLSVGLAFVLGFIGLKLISETLHHHGVSWAPEIPILGSLGVIVGTLAITTIASLVKVRRDRIRAAEAAQTAKETEAVKAD